MNITPRKSKQIVDAYLRSNSFIQTEMLVDVAKSLRRKHRAGSVGEMARLLRTALVSERLFEYKKEGQTFYETKEAKRRRCRIPNRAPKSVYRNATEPALS
jgi:hypothetical protein